MRGRTKQFVQSLPVGQRLLGDRIVDIVDRLVNTTRNPAGLVIKAGGSAVVKAGNAFHATISDGIRVKLVGKAANTDMAALSGTVTNAKHNVYAFFIDIAGTLTSSMGVEGATLAAVEFPAIPVGKACIGYLYVNPTGTGDFVGGTTALDDATVVPNRVFIDTPGFFDPTLLQ